MRTYLERITKREITRVVTTAQLDALTRNSIIKEKLPVVKDGEIAYKVKLVRYSPISYDNLVDRLVRKTYSQSNVEAILRKAILNPSNEEYIALNNYAEECKVLAKEYIAERTALFGK